LKNERLGLKKPKIKQKKEKLIIEKI